MLRVRSWMLPAVLVAAAASVPSSFAAEVKFPAGPDAFAPPILVAMPEGVDSFVTRVVTPIDERELARRIDAIVAARWAEMGATPAPMSDDAEFLRRAALDVAGRIPLASEAQEFFQDRDPEKRQKLVNALLDGPAYPNHMTNLWRELMLPEAAGNFQIQFFTADFDVWLRSRFANNTRYDQIVREVLTVSVQNGQNIFNARRGQTAKPSPFAYLAAKDGKPENLAGSAARLFMGVRIECAQCHNHPFAKWKREEFWGLAAFFSGIQRQGNGDAIFQATDTGKAKPEITIPGSKLGREGRLPRGEQPDWKKTPSPREALALWLTSKENPYFAKEAVNRVWSQFFGTGIVDPVDDMGSDHAPSHPEVIETLTDQFVAHDFDMKYLIRAITSSRAYQLSSAGGSPSSDAYHLYDRMAVKGLTPIQLYDSMIRATGIRREPPPPAFSINPNSLRGEFLERFSNQDEKPTERQMSILQALTLMNGRLVTDGTTPGNGKTLSAVADAFFLDTPGKIEMLYLATLSRRPTPEEVGRLVPYLEQGGTSLNPRKAMADVFWSLVGSAEFVLNH